MTTQEKRAFVKNKIVESVPGVMDLKFGCEVKEKAWNREQLETIIKGLNPITFFCDKCHASAEDVNKQLLE